jgi:hypothetical protein
MKYSSIVMVALLFIGLDPTARADWVQTNGPYGGSVSCLAFSPNGSGGTYLFAGTDSGVFLSTDNGTSAGSDAWPLVFKRFRFNPPTNGLMESMFFDGPETEEQRGVSPTFRVPSFAPPCSV